MLSGVTGQLGNFFLGSILRSEIPQAILGYGNDNHSGRRCASDRHCAHGLCFNRGLARTPQRI